MGDIVKKISLAGLMEGWDDDCYAYVKPATFTDRKTFRDSTKTSDDEAEAFQNKLVTDHFVSGKVRTLSADGTFELVDLTAEHLNISVLNDKLALEIMGFEFDPKDLAGLPPLPTTPTNYRNTTETPSSETSGSTSPTK